MGKNAYRRPVSHFECDRKYPRVLFYRTCDAASSLRAATSLGKDAQAAEGFDRRVDGVRDLRFVRDVERNSPYTQSELASDLDQLLRIAGRGHNAVSGLEGLFAKRSAKAAGCCGN